MDNLKGIRGLGYGLLGALTIALGTPAIAQESSPWELLSLASVYESNTACLSTAMLAKPATHEATLAENSLDTELFQFIPNPLIYILDFSTLMHQAITLNRLGYFIEHKDAPRDRVLSDNEIEALIGYQLDYEFNIWGFDFRASDIARFYNFAESQRITLNSEEHKLLELVLQNSIIAKHDEGYVPTNPERALLSVPEDIEFYLADFSPSRLFPEERASVLSHELSHGEYFTNPEYKAYCAEFWNTALTFEERAEFTRWLGEMSYDTSNLDLIINETQAYIGHTGDKLYGLNIPEPRLQELHKAFFSSSPIQSFIMEAQGKF
jgi:hypothetical protein